MINVRVRGVDAYIRSLVKANDFIFDEAREGIEDAAEYLKEKIEDKFGTYQQTGGDPNGYGRWKKLAEDTRWKKARKYGFADKPLVATGAAQNSWSIKKGGKGRLSASVSSSSDYLIHHIYGAPGANVPMRDPARITAKEELEACNKIIEKKILNGIRRAGF